MEKITIPLEDTSVVSDGYHTFGELYEHRIILFIALCRQLRLKINADNVDGVRMADISKEIWCSTRHSDNSTFGDWFVLGIGKEKGKQMIYHLPARFWSEVCEFAEVLEKAPEFDGHTSADVLERIKAL